MSRHDRERRQRETEAGAPDHALFAREVEVAATEQGTEFRIRPNATAVMGPNQTRAVSLFGGVILLMLGVGVAGYIYGQKPPTGLLFLFPLVVFGGLGLLC